MLDVEIEDGRWTDVGLEDLAQQAVDATLTDLNLADKDCEIVVLACDDDRIAVLNAEFRDKPKATNVLSWPAEDLSPGTPGGQPTKPQADFTGEIALGDIAISFDTCAREADAAGKPLCDHVRHLVIHGTLHLLGYDHIDDADATVMENLEIAILGKLGIANPYTQDHDPIPGP